MPWYHWIANFLDDALPQLRATRRTNLALLTAAILQRRTLVISVLVRSWRIQLPYSHPITSVRSGYFAFCPTPLSTAWRRRRRCWDRSVRRPGYGGWFPS